MNGIRWKKTETIGFGIGMLFTEAIVMAVKEKCCNGDDNDGKDNGNRDNNSYKFMRNRFP